MKKNLCKCGCGRIVKEGKIFIHGHNSRNKKVLKETRQKISKALINIPKSDKARENMSKTKTQMFKDGLLKTPSHAFKKGNVPWIKNRKHTKISLKKMSIAHTGNLLGDANPTKRPEVREIIRLGKLGEKNPMYGSPLSKTHRENISKGNKGRIVTEKTRQKISQSLKEHPVTKETKAKQSIAKIGRYIGDKNPMFGKTGELSPNWLGGKSFEPYGIEFNKKLKKEIKERDGCCMLCNVNFEDLKLLKRKVHIHHIDYFKQNNFPQNLISLCASCHIKTNFDREIWTKHFQLLLSKRYDYNYSENGEIIVELKNEK